MAQDQNDDRRGQRYGADQHGREPPFPTIEASRFDLGELLVQHCRLSYQLWAIPPDADVAATLPLRGTPAPTNRTPEAPGEGCCEIAEK